MLVHEYRFVMPLSPEEYKIGYLYTVLKSTASETGGGEGAQFLETRRCFEGRYRKKAYFLKEKAPTVVRRFIPKGEKLLHLNEESWNTFPTSETVLTTPSFMKDKFYIKIRSVVEEGREVEKNVFKLRGEELKKRVVEDVNIADITKVRPEDYGKNEDPSTFRSKGRGKAGHHRGPLEPHWLSKYSGPTITVYKLVECHFQMPDVQKQVESRIQDGARRILVMLHRRAFCWMDLWAHLTHPEIILLEKEIKGELDRFRQEKPVRGSKF